MIGNSAPAQDLTQGRTEYSEPRLQATAIRGAVRMVFETMSHSCLTLIDGTYERRTVDYHHAVPEAFRPCTSAEAACPACQLFGLSPLAARAHISSRLHFSDTFTPIGGSITTLYIPALQAPKPHHRRFYVDETEQIAGRKFYYHRPSGPVIAAAGDRGSHPITAIAMGTRMSFSVDFSNLSHGELSSLLYALVLEDGLAHKLGGAKPLGFGTAVLTIRCATLRSSEDVTLGLTGERLMGEDLAAWVKALTRRHHEERSETLEALRDVLALNPPEPTQYPSATWFSSHPTTPLTELVGPAVRTRTIVPGPQSRRSPVIPPVPAPGPQRPAIPAPVQQARSVRPKQQAQVQPVRPQEEEPAATLADLLQHFGSRSQPKEDHGDTTRRSQRAREEQRRLMERLRRKE
ncbi:MAG: RAMP superfamily CRISPR-associated protein [Chloroflexi bacterium]|nr:RAMP superfamily CRISPR-associated protein [Chloroflexota bacterium]